MLLKQNLSHNFKCDHNVTLWSLKTAVELFFLSQCCTVCSCCNAVSSKCMCCCKEESRARKWFSAACISPSIYLYILILFETRMGFSLTLLCWLGVDLELKIFWMKNSGVSPCLNICTQKHVIGSQAVTVFCPWVQKLWAANKLVLKIILLESSRKSWFPNAAWKYMRF